VGRVWDAILAKGSRLVSFPPASGPATPPVWRRAAFVWKTTWTRRSIRMRPGWLEVKLGRETSSPGRARLGQAAGAEAQPYRLKTAPGDIPRHGAAVVNGAGVSERSPSELTPSFSDTRSRGHDRSPIISSRRDNRSRGTGPRSPRGGGEASVLPGLGAISGRPGQVLTGRRIQPGNLLGRGGVSNG